MRGVSLLKRFCPILVLLVFPGPVRAEDTPARLTAGEILQSVRARLPQETLRIDGTLLVRRQRGVVVRNLNFNMTLNWGASPSTATYTILGAHGEELERLAVRRESGLEPEYRYASGPDLANTNPPSLYGPIQESDLSWIDLTLAFLWWEDGLVSAIQPVRGRECFVLDVNAPPSEGSPYRRVRMWIDVELRMLLQAEAFGAEGEPIRRLWVKSFKKIKDRWMIKDMEIQSYPVNHRTKLSIADIGE
jgi:hypothetical protein